MVHFLPCSLFPLHWPGPQQCQIHCIVTQKRNSKESIGDHTTGKGNGKNMFEISFLSHTLSHTSHTHPTTLTNPEHSCSHKVSVVQENLNVQQISNLISKYLSSNVLNFAWSAKIERVHSMSIPLSYQFEQEDLEDPPSLRPGAHTNGHQSRSQLLKKKSSLFQFPSFKRSGHKKQGHDATNFDNSLYSFSNPHSNANSTTLSSTNLENLNNRLQSFKSSRSLSMSQSGHFTTGVGENVAQSLGGGEGAAGQKIPQLFADHFTYSKADVAELLSGHPTSSHAPSPLAPTGHDLLILEEGGGSGRDGNQNPIIQSLKAALKTMTSEIDSLEEKCSAMEQR